MTVLPELDADEVVLGNANLLGVYVAAVGATAPDEVAVDYEEWTTLGWVSEDGVKIKPERSIEELKAWQSPTAIKTTLKEFKITVDLQLLQHNAQTLALYWGQPEPTEESPSGNITLDVDVTGDTIPEVALLVDTRDGDRIARYYFYQAQVVSVGELSIVRGGFQALPITFTALDPGTGIPATVYLLSDDESSSA